MAAAAAGRLPVCVAQVDGNGRLPLQATDLVFSPRDMHVGRDPHALVVD